MDWEDRAIALADRVTDPDSRWLAPIARTPRHQLVPRWWELAGEEWVLRVGSLDAAYEDRSLVTRVGAVHADHAEVGARAEGLPTSSSTMPSLVVQMLRHGRLGQGLSLLDLGTGAGGLAAYACRRLGARCVTSLDVDPYVVRVAGERLAELGHHPAMLTADATEHVPGAYDRIVSTVALSPGAQLRPVLRALEPGGRLVTTLAGTCLVVTGWKNLAGDVVGRVERGMAGFMSTRSGDNYPCGQEELLAHALDAEGEHRSIGRYPVVDVSEAWELRSMLEVTTPGVELAYRAEDLTRTAYLVHPDGSWARATAEGLGAPDIHEGGPRRLWQSLDRIRNRLNTEGSLPLLGADLRITPDGVCHLSRGRWRASLGNH
ncbi:methyltransferase domain-containing protein [Streptomyces sp. S6]